MAINVACISGNLTKDPDLRSTAGGMPVLGFSVAVNDRRKNQQTGQWEDYPNYIDCTMFGKRAEAISRHLAKGMRVSVQGRLRQCSWTDRDGKKRSKIEVVADEVVFQPPAQAVRAEVIDDGCYDDDIPF